MITTLKKGMRVKLRTIADFYYRGKILDIGSLFIMIHDEVENKPRWFNLTHIKELEILEDA